MIATQAPGSTLATSFPKSVETSSIFSWMYNFFASRWAPVRHKPLRSGARIATGVPKIHMIVIFRAIAAFLRK